MFPKTLSFAMVTIKVINFMLTSPIVSTTSLLLNSCRHLVGTFLLVLSGVSRLLRSKCSKSTTSKKLMQKYEYLYKVNVCIWVRPEHFKEEIIHM